LFFPLPPLPSENFSVDDLGSTFQHFKVSLEAQEGGLVGRHAPQGAGLGGTSTHFIQTFKNDFFSRNLGQNLPKNAYFLEKWL